MTLAQIIGWLTLVLTFAVAMWRGDRPERIGVILITVAWIATAFAQRLDSWYSPQFGIMGVDAVTLAALIFLAFWYNRYWPICAAAFQAVAVLTDLLFLVDPKALYRAYYHANFSIGFLLLGTIVGGVVIERSSPVRRRWVWTSPAADSAT